MLGALTYSLTRALRRATPQTTYGELRNRLIAEVGAFVHDQTPEVTGDGTQAVLGGTAAPAPPALLVQTAAGDAVTIPSGWLSGVTSGSRYALYRAGADTKDDKNLLADVERHRGRCDQQPGEVER